MLSAAILCSILGVYAWQRRAFAGARPFAIMLLFVMLWSMGAVLQLAAEDYETKVFWFKFIGVMKLPTATAELCFGIQFTGLGRFLTRRNLLLLALPPLFVLLIGLTNDFHHWLWLGFNFDGNLHPVRSTFTYITAGYSFLLAFIMAVLLFRLFIRSPQHRWPVALILIELVIARAAVLVDFLGINPVIPLDPVVLSWNAGAILYAAALFGFRIFDEISLARQTAILQMHDGLVLLDTQGRIASLNPAAQLFFGASGKNMLGQSILTLLPEYSALTGSLSAEDEGRIEISRDNGGKARNFMLGVSELKDWQGIAVGRLLLLHDVTDQRLIQKKLVEQQRALATMQEREHLARELHDSVGQVLGYASFQVEAISRLVLDGKNDIAAVQLERLAEIVRASHADVREYILNLHATPFPDQAFFTALEKYLQGFSNNYEIQTVFSLDDQLDAEPFLPEARMQIFRILQEALSNARKHGRAHCIQVMFARKGNFVRMTVQDDGVGFDPSQMSPGGNGHFGLQFMRERAETLGGGLVVTSSPGLGTQVEVWAPYHDMGLNQKKEITHD